MFRFQPNIDENIRRKMIEALEDLCVQMAHCDDCVREQFKDLRDTNNPAELSHIAQLIQNDMEDFHQYTILCGQKLKQLSQNSSKKHFKK